MPGLMVDPHDDCCGHVGNITGFLQLCGDDTEPAEITEKMWQRLLEIDQAGKPPGIYELEIFTGWLVVAGFPAGRDPGTGIATALTSPLRSFRL